MAITGAGGQLGSALVQLFAAKGDEVLALRRPSFDITRPDDVEMLRAERLDVLINTAAWTDVDGCAKDPQNAMLVNGTAAGWVAQAADSAGALVVQISTNEVFDGGRSRPYGEDDPAGPINAYGRSKLAGERAVASMARRYLVIRTAWIYGGRAGFPVKIRAAAARAREAGQALRVVADEIGNPTPVAILARRIRDASRLAEEGGVSVLHLAGQPPASRYDWARHILGGTQLLEPISQREYARASRPPRRAVLDTSLAGRLGLEPITWRDNAG